MLCLVGEVCSQVGRSLALFRFAFHFWVCIAACTVLGAEFSARGTESIYRDHEMIF
jgi:hypothetical protein